MGIALERLAVGFRRKLIAPREPPPRCMISCAIRDLRRNGYRHRSVLGSCTCGTGRVHGLPLFDRRCGLICVRQCHSAGGRRPRCSSPVSKRPLRASIVGRLTSSSFARYVVSVSPDSTIICSNARALGSRVCARISTSSNRSRRSRRLSDPFSNATSSSVRRLWVVDVPSPLKISSKESGSRPPLALASWHEHPASHV